MVYSTDVFSFLAKIEKLKLSVDKQMFTKKEKDLIHSYLNKVLDFAQELKSQC